MVTEIKCGKITLGKGNNFEQAAVNFLEAASANRDCLLKRIWCQKGVRDLDIARMLYATAVIGAFGYSELRGTTSRAASAKDILRYLIGPNRTFTWTLFRLVHGAPSVRIDDRETGRQTGKMITDVRVGWLLNRELIEGLTRFAATRNFSDLRSGKTRSFLTFPGTQRDWQNLYQKLRSINDRWRGIF